MHVGVNLIFLVPGETGGTETYARELVPELVAQRPDLELTFFVNRETGVAGQPWAELGRCVEVPVEARRRSQWVRGEQVLLPELVRRSSCDLLHSLANTAPLRGRFVRVTTIQDLLHRRRVRAHTPARAVFLRFLVPQVIRRSDRVLVPSYWTRAEVLALRACDPARIDVVPHGAGRTPIPAASFEDVQRRYALDRRQTVLVVAPLRRHKQVEVVVDAIAAIPAGRRPLAVLVGEAGGPDAERLRAYARATGVADDVRFAGSVGDAELEALYATAACLVAPAPYEGFGFPAAEAMARGLPVVYADGGSLPEVVADAGIRFEPGRAESLAPAVERILGDPAERARLVAAGRGRAAELSWAAAARATLRAYEAAVGSTATRAS